MVWVYTACGVGVVKGQETRGRVEGEVVARGRGEAGVAQQVSTSRFLGSGALSVIWSHVVRLGFV